MQIMIFFVNLTLVSVHAFSGINRLTNKRNNDALVTSNEIKTAAQAAMIASCLFFPMLSSAAPDFMTSPSMTISKSYSQNARNFDRLNEGDFSGGSVYDNNPSSPGARRRRAMQGCKIQSTREEASDRLNLKRFLSEKECNQKVMESDPDFMLTAMQALECSKCPYGISSSR
mmetsp:Transcript_25348/g.37432  ORF Transcript_25348/g.37432 Transcript_25348/m.37432 type:complete len:172 (+) Transcript_25348:240-755(+)